MKRTIPTWLAVVVIVIVIAVIAVIFWLAGQRRISQPMPEGFKPTPPLFKEVPAQKR